MKAYKIVHTETLMMEVYVDAETDEEALAKYQTMLNNGEIDFSDEDLVDSSDEVVCLGEVAE